MWFLYGVTRNSLGKQRSREQIQNEKMCHWAISSSQIGHLAHDVNVAGCMSDPEVSFISVTDFMGKCPQYTIYMTMPNMKYTAYKCSVCVVCCWLFVFFFIGGTKNVDAPEIIYIYLGMNIDSNCIFQDAYKRCSCLFMYHECVTNFMCSKNDDIRVRYQSPSLWMFSSHVDHICHLHLTPQMRVSIDKAFPSLV